MVFCSLAFLLLFLPIFLVCYYLCPQKHKNLCLFLFSLGFYAYGVWEHPAHLILLLCSIVANFTIGLALERHPSRALLTLGLFFNFSILFVFKYADFLIFEVRQLLGTAAAMESHVLPMGISFYTFQAAAYLIDVYRWSCPAEHSIIRFGTYITMFPQLVSGPIVRYPAIRCFLEKRRHTLPRFLFGLRQFIFGLALKALFANRIGSLWRTIAGIGYESISTPLAWMGILACSLQIYFDFWGYSLMAMGLGRMIGFRLPVNFRHPYQSRSMTEFWRRWHITLGAWFRDYVYIPLGGSRCGSWKTYRNLLAVWLLTGIWHGAGWNFLLWGLFLFAVIAIEKAGLLHFLEKHPIFSHAYMLLLIPLCWLLFSISDMRQLGIYLSRLLGLGGPAVFPGDYLKYANSHGIYLAAGVLFCTPFPYRTWKKIRTTWAEALILAIILLSTLYYLYMGMQDTFLYFAF